MEREEPMATRTRDGMPLGVGLYLHKRAARLANTSSRQLTYWASTGLIDPQVHRRDGGPSVYAYSDLIAIRAVIRLRAVGLSLQKVRKAVEYIYCIVGVHARWWDFKMAVYGNELAIVIPPDQSPTGQEELVMASRGGQKPFVEISFGELARDLVSTDGLEQHPDIAQHVEIRAEVQGGAPVLKGTRIKTSTVYYWSTCGLTPQQIANMYDGVSETAVSAAVRFEETLIRRN